MHRMAALREKRREARRGAASASVSRILQEASAQGIDITLIGSLARDDFRTHSDVDLLVRGQMTAKRRLLAEQLVASEMRTSDIAYDLIFEADISDERLRDFLHDAL